MDLDLLLQEVEKAKISGSPFVIYKKPETNKINALFPLNKQINYLSDFSEKGFVFAPFDDRKKTVIFPFHKCKLISFEVPELSIEKNKMTAKISKNDQGKKDHLILVEKGIYFLKKNKFNKVVLSRKEVIKIDGFDFKSVFKNLLSNYPYAFNYIWFHSEIGMWMGASPETLIKTNSEQFETMSLAGTQIYKGSLDVEWDKKEKQEQQYVTDFIVSQLSDFDLQVSKIFSKRAGNLIHICTTITGTYSRNFKLGKLIQNLHPTPAICGLPKKEAKDFILNNEAYDREYYTGYLGELNIDKRTNLYVNLRCMKIRQDSLSNDACKNVNLYIGGGITVASDPENEWEETDAKSKVMKEVLF